jgi:hypothetical protein
MQENAVFGPAEDLVGIDRVPSHYSTRVCIAVARWLREAFG